MCDSQRSEPVTSRATSPTGVPPTVEEYRASLSSNWTTSELWYSLARWRSLTPNQIAVVHALASEEGSAGARYSSPADISHAVRGFAKRKSLPVPEACRSRAQRKEKIANG